MLYASFHDFVLSSGNHVGDISPIIVCSEWPRPVWETKLDVCIINHLPSLCTL